jgi:hypothetical protein
VDLSAHASLLRQRARNPVPLLDEPLLLFAHVLNVEELWFLASWFGGGAHAHIVLLLLVNGCVAVPLVVMLTGHRVDDLSEPVPYLVLLGVGRTVHLGLRQSQRAGGAMTLIGSHVVYSELEIRLRISAHSWNLSLNVR